MKPRIVYPISPGGTEIKPPPMHRSPRRGTRSPSPARAKTIVPPPQPVVEPQSDIQRLVVALEALRQGKGSESRVEDVKTVPELPKLEIKDSEKELMPLIAGDWLALVSPSMRDLSANATQWWSEVLAASNEYYATWLAASPIDRIS